MTRLFHRVGRDYEPRVSSADPGEKEVPTREKLITAEGDIVESLAWVRIKPTPLVMGAFLVEVRS